MLPARVQATLRQLVGDNCYRLLFSRLDFLSDTKCTQLALSKLLGSAIVVGGGLVKVPQILKIVGAGSVKGLSVSAYLLETIGYSITLAYNYRNQNPFSTYGEVALVNAQNFFIIMLILGYRSQILFLAVLSLALVCGSVSLFHPTLIDAKMMMILQTCTIPVSVASKLPQIWSNWRQGNTGQLSAITVFLFFVGSFVRIFTTVQEVKDNVLIAGYVLATGLNAVLLAQVLMYWKATAQLDQKKKTR